MRLNPPLRLSEKPRYNSLDGARGFAICLALGAHLIEVFRQELPILVLIGDVLSPLLRSATAVFILLMGALLEILHGIPKNQESLQRYKWRLPQRALSCYLYGICIIGLGEFLTLNPPGETWKSALYLGSGRMSHAFQFIPLMLLCSVPLIALRRTGGLLPLFFLGLGLWGIGFLLPDVGFTGQAFRLNYLLGNIIGRPLKFSGFSLLHMIPLLVIGFAIGRAIVKQPEWLLSKRLFLLGSLLVITAVMIVVEKQGSGWGLVEILGFRKNHHPYYYTLVCGMGFLILSTFLALNHKGLRLPLLEWIGRHSIVFFFLGNSALLVSNWLIL